MTENILILVFTYAFGLASGRALRDYQLAKQTVIGMTALYNSDWWHSNPSAQAARLHPVQDVTGDLPEPPMNIWSPPALPYWTTRPYRFERWRAPQLRRSA